MPASSATTTHLLQRLHQLRRLFTPEATAEKLQLLHWLAGVVIRQPGRLRRLHDDLLYLLAFPDNAEVHEATARLLASFHRRVRRLTKPQRRSLDDSGIPGTESRHVFVFGIARWLATRHSRAVTIDWPAMEDPSGLDQLLQRFMTPVESDAAEVDAMNTRAWLRVSSAGSPSDAEWVIRQLARTGAPPRQAVAYDNAGVPLRWMLRGPGAAAVHRSLPHHAVRHRTALRPSPRRPREAIALHLPGIDLLPPDDAERVIDAARSALAARCREVHAISYPNPHEVYLADLGEGIRLAVIGVDPPLRMGLEANYGYVLFGGGVPIGYGGVSPLFFDANTGINIFDAFRGSEAGFLWAAMLRAFRTLFGTTRFIVNAYQFGEGNREAIESGAFWFYYRLGFRPATAATRRLAAAEFKRLDRDRGYRTDRRTLRALASGDLHLVLPDFRRELAFEEQELGDLALAVARRVALESSDRAVALRRITSSVATGLGARGGTQWPVAEQRAFASMAPLAALVTDLPEWRPEERRALVAMMRAKGRPRERDYVLRAQQHPKFVRALRAAVRGQDSRRAARYAPPGIPPSGADTIARVPGRDTREEGQQD